jgi:hypothetical protein
MLLLQQTSCVVLFLQIFFLKQGTTIGGGGRSLAVLTLKVDHNLFEVGHA